MSEDRATFDLTREQHDLGFPGCDEVGPHEHRLPISTFRVPSDSVRVSFGFGQGSVQPLPDTPTHVTP